MKKHLRFLVIIMIVFLFTGCFKYNYNLKVSEDKQVDVEMIMSYAYSDDEDVIDSEEQTEQSNSEWKIEKYQDTQFKGKKYSKHYDNIDEVTTDGKNVKDLNKLFEKGIDSKYLFTKTKKNGREIYSAKLAVDLSNIKESKDNISKEMQEQVDLKVLVEVPEVIKSNATSKNGNTLIWDLKKFKGKSIEFEFAFPKQKSLSIIPIIIIIGCGILLIVIILVSIILFKKKKKIVNEPIEQEVSVEEVNSEPVTEQEGISN